MEEPQPGQPPQQNAPYRPFGVPAPDPVTGPILPPRNPMVPRGRANVATVEVYQRRDMRVVWPGGHTTGGARGLLQRPSDVFDVDLGTHRVTFSTELPAGGDGALRFPADIDIEWRVVDPALVVRTDLRNVATALEPRLQRLIRRVAAKVSAMSPAVAEDRINEMLDGDEVRQIGLERGLAISVFARLHANADVIEAKAKVIGVVGENEVEQIKSEQIARRAQQFAAHIATGDMHQMAALLMANDPSSMKSVVEELWNQRAVSQREAIDFMNRLIGSGLVQKHQISDQIRVVMDWMHQATTAVIAGPPRQAVTPGLARQSLERGYDAGADDAPAPDRTTLRARRRWHSFDDDEDEREANRDRRGRYREPRARAAERPGRAADPDWLDDEDRYAAPAPRSDVRDGYEHDRGGHERDGYDRDGYERDSGGHDRDRSEVRGDAERKRPRTSAPRPQQRFDAPPPADDEYDTEYTVKREEYEDRRGPRAQPGRARWLDEEDGDVEPSAAESARPGDRRADDDYQDRDRRRDRERDEGRDWQRDEDRDRDGDRGRGQERPEGRHDAPVRSTAATSRNGSSDEEYPLYGGGAGASSPARTAESADSRGSGRGDFYSDDDWGGA